MLENRAKTYAEKLKDPRWQKKRLKILERDGWACTVCGDSESTLHVHHWRYLPNQEPWDYPDDDLSALCEDCHATEAEARREAESILLEATQIRHLTAADVHSIATEIYSFPENGEVLGTFLNSYHRDEGVRKAFWGWVKKKSIGLSRR